MNRLFTNYSTLLGAVLFFLLPCLNIKAAAPGKSAAPETWTFVSMPDFINVDTTYPQAGWEGTLDYVLKAVKAENPDFVLVAGDLLMGHWANEEKISKCAALYYPAWINRMNDHGLNFYAAIGDHEIGDNPWPPEKAKLVPAYKQAFRDYLKMPLNGPKNMKGTAFYFMHKNTLFVSVDVFEPGKGSQGEITPKVTGEQLKWLDETLTKNSSVDHVVVMGHTPVLGPVRKQSSSGMLLDGGQQSPFWQCLAKHKVDLYLCGEVHAITCTEKDGVQQIAHGGLLGYNPKVNYLVVRMSPQKVELELKELDIVCTGEKLWQEGLNRPRKSVTISEEIQKRGYVSVGKMTIDKTSGQKKYQDKTGYFDETDNPKENTAALPSIPPADNSYNQPAASGFTFVAADSAFRRAVPGFIQNTNVWRVGRPLEKVFPDDPARAMFFGPTVTAAFAALETGADYELELIFLSDSNNRTVRIAANGVDLEKQLVLPKEEVLKKRWKLPPETSVGGELTVSISAITGPNAILSGIAVYANKTDAVPLTALPPRVNGKMVARETADQNSFNSFVQCTNRWELTETATNEPLRTMFVDKKNITAVFTGAEAATRYGVELSFLSGSTDRSVRISSGDTVLENKLALPKAQILRKYLPIPPKSVKDDRIEITVTKLSGPNVVLSGIAVFADNAKAKTLAAPAAAPLPAELIPSIRLTPRPADVTGVSTLKIDLNGIWKFNPAPPPEFGNTSAGGAGWQDIQVPGEWVMQGFKVAPNTAAGYTRKFSVPEDWNGQRVKLRCDAVYSDAKIWINGQEAGSHLGGFTPFELDVTRFVKPGTDNTINLTVKNESLADSLACGSQYAAHPLGGVPRKIYLFAVPKLNLADIFIRTEFDREFVNATLIAQVQIANDSESDSSPSTFELSLPGSVAKPLMVDVPAIKAGQSFATELRMPVPSPRK